MKLISSNPLSLRNNFAWSSVGNFIYLAGQWVILVLIAKLGNVEMVGQYSLALAISAPIVVFSQMLHRQTLITDVKQEFRFKDYFWTRSLLTTLALSIVGAIVILGEFNRESSIVVCLVSLAKCFESMSDLFYGHFQKLERMDFIAVSMILKAIVSTLLFFFLLQHFRDLSFALLGTVIAQLGILILYDFLGIYRRFYPDSKPYVFRFRTFKKLIIITWPLAVSSGLVTLSANMPRYFLDFFHGKTAVGLFSVAAAPLVFLTMLHSSLGQTVIVRASKNFQFGDFTNFLRLTRKITAIFFLTGIAFFLTFLFLGKEILTVLFSVDYVKGLPALLIMAGGIVLNSFSTTGSLVILGGRFFKIQAYTIYLMVAVQALFSFLLIPKYDILGAGIADFLRILSSIIFYIVAGKYLLNKRKEESLQSIKIDS